MGTHAELTAIAIVGLAALFCGMVMTRLRLPPVAGYILAGILLGPTAFQLVENQQQIQLLAHLGVLMLLFMIGMELHALDFMKLWRLALTTLAAQLGAFLLLAFGLSRLFGWPVELAVILAFVATLSSTAVAIKMLEEIGEDKTETGRLCLAILIAQDLAVIPMLLIVADLPGTGSWVESIVQVIIATLVITAIMAYLARKGRFRLPFASWIGGHPELRPIAALALCLAAAVLADAIGLSAAYGAFLAGLVLGNTRGLRPLIEAAKPIEGLLMMVFFLSIGLLIDLDYIWANLGEVLLWLAVVTLVKTALNIAILRLQGQPWQRAFLAGVVLGQVGEFSFLVAAAGATAGLVAPEHSRLIVAIVALSLLVSPIWLVTARRLHAAAAGRRANLASLLGYLYGTEAKWIAMGLRTGTDDMGEVIHRTGTLLGRGAAALSGLRSRWRDRRRAGKAAQADVGPGKPRRRSPKA
ncbi:MAG: cation/H(+) antiporter [Alphaproteobacteria bacterium]|nr:cation:proton antiporter [Pseudomonadota bacterium]TDI68353.1 MAG: cation/H(+) antiporter [Alphaproteobacteria bacterium]